MNSALNVPKKKVCILNGISHSKNFLYLMRRDQRIFWNYAVIFGYQLSYKSESQLYIGIEFDKLTLNKRQQKFFVEGILEIYEACQEKNIHFHIINNMPLFLQSWNIDCIILDYSPLRQCSQYYKEVTEFCKANKVALYQVFAHHIVPLSLIKKGLKTSRDVKAEIRKHFSEYFIPFPVIPVHHYNKMLEKSSCPELASSNVENYFIGGTSSGMKVLHKFYNTKLQSYAEKRNDIDSCNLSELSPWLHAGHISSQQILIIGKKRFGFGNPNFLSFFNEVHGWKSISEYFVMNNSDYDTVRAAEDWVLRSFQLHKNDPREVIYSLDELMHSKTRDKHWNAGQRELMCRGVL